MNGPLDALFAHAPRARPWLEAAVVGLLEVTPTALSLAARVDSWGGLDHVTGVGAVIPLISDHSNVELVFISSTSGCAVLARALVGMDPEEDISPEDVADAMCELANIVAGVVKRQLHATEPGLTLGLPVAFEGRLMCVDGYAAARVSVGVTDVEVLATRQARGVTV